MTDENRFNHPPLPDPSFVFRTRCHPEANGRKPKPGDRFWCFSCVLEDGRVLAVACGAEGHRDLRDMLFQEEVDDAVERLLGSE